MENYVVFSSQEKMHYPIIYCMDEATRRIKKIIDFLDENGIDFKRTIFYGTGTSGAMILSLLSTLGMNQLCLIKKDETHGQLINYSGIKHFYFDSLVNHIFIDDLISSGKTLYRVESELYDYNSTILTHVCTLFEYNHSIHSELYDIKSQQIPHITFKR